MKNGEGRTEAGTSKTEWWIEEEEMQNDKVTERPNTDQRGLGSQKNDSNQEGERTGDIYLSICLSSDLYTAFQGSSHEAQGRREVQPEARPKLQPV